MRLDVSQGGQMVMTLPGPSKRDLVALSRSHPEEAGIIFGGGEASWEVEAAVLVRAAKTIIETCDQKADSIPLVRTIEFTNSSGRSFGRCKGCTGPVVRGVRVIAEGGNDGRCIFIFGSENKKRPDLDLTGVLRFHLDNGHLDIEYKRKGNMLPAALKALVDWLARFKTPTDITISQC